MSISTLISAGTAPTSDRDVWAAPLAMQVNWKNPVTVRTGFETRIEQALTLSEQRRLLRGTPRRSISCTLTGTGRVETLSARQLLTRRSMAGFLMPLYSDQIELTAAANSPATTATVLTSDARRCFVGDRAVLMSRKNGVTSDFEVVEVSGVASQTITFTGGITGDYPAGSVLIPLMESHMVDSYSNGFVLTDDKADFQNFTAQEIVGPTQIEGVSTVGSNPSGFDTFDSLPVFDGPIDYSQIRFGLNRIGAFSDVGIGQLPVFYGERAVQTFSALVQCTNRAHAWDLLRFFESRGGRAYPFFFRSPLKDYLYAGVNGNNLLVEDTGDLLDWNYRPYLVMELSDGSYDYREINTVTQNGSNHEISFVGGDALGTVVSARQLFKVRMFRDEIAERWLTTDRCQMTLEVVEVLEEKTVSMTETLATDTGASVVTEDGDLIGLGIAVSDDATTAVSPDLAMGGCDGTPYQLTHCVSGAKSYTSTDLSASVGAVVEIGGECYSVTEDWVQGNPITDVTVDDTHDDCIDCLPPPCTDCDPTDGGESPNTATAGGATDLSSCYAVGPTSLPYASFSDNANHCQWQFQSGVGAASNGGSLEMHVYYFKTSHSFSNTPCPAMDVVAGQWALYLGSFSPAGQNWLKITSGFACNPDTGKISGSDTLDTASDGCGTTGTDCSGLVSVVVPA